MIYTILGLIFFAIWYSVDKKLGERFMTLLKWGSLAVIVLLVIFDINMMYETNHFIDVRKADPTGLDVSAWNNETNTTVVTTMYGMQTQDSLNIMIYHDTEYAIWPILLSLVPYLFIMIAGFMVLQTVYVIYQNHTSGKKEML